MNTEKWNPSDKVNEAWEDISPEAYKFMIERASIKNNEILSNSHVITERSIKMLYAFISVLIMLFASTYKNPPNYYVLISISVFGAINFYVFYKILFGARLYVNGAEPKNMLTDKLVTKYKDCMLTNLYYDEVVKLQRAIIWNRKAVKQRICFYYANMILTVAVIAISVSVLAYDIKELIKL